MSFFENLKVDYKSGCLENYSRRKTKLENQYWYPIFTSSYLIANIEAASTTY